MMESPRLCPTCHQPLAPDAPQGLCPTCLLRAGFPTGAGPETGEATAPGAATTARAAFVPPAVGDLAKLFPQFEIVALLGRGGMGAVYQARQPALDRRVALKILPREATTRPGFSERFNREARALARLNHPGIVAVYEFGEAGGLPYFVMEFVDGVTLRQLVREQRIDARAALQIVPAICDALQYAHDEGVVHRDIKPENILVDRRGRVKIADFGIARIMDESDATTGRTREAHEVVGTPHYMAPEQLERPQTVDHRADIFALGVVFYEMLTGELPLGRFPPPSQKFQIDVRLDEIVLRALEKDPARRYQQAGEVKTQVETVAAGPIVPTPSGAGKRPAAWVPYVWAAGVVPLGLVFVGLLLKRPSVFTTAALVVALMIAAAGMGLAVLARHVPKVWRWGVVLPVMAVAAVLTVGIALFTNRATMRQLDEMKELIDRDAGRPAPQSAGWPEYDQMEDDPATLQLLIDQARSNLALEQSRAEAGVSDPAQLDAAREKLSLLEARLQGDRVGFARIKLAGAEKRLARVVVYHQAGVTTAGELRQAEVEAEIARRRLAREEQRQAAASDRPAEKSAP